MEEACIWAVNHSTWPKFFIWCLFCSIDCYLLQTLKSFHAHCYYCYADYIFTFTTIMDERFVPIHTHQLIFCPVQRGWSTSKIHELLSIIYHKVPRLHIFKNVTIWKNMYLISFQMRCTCGCCIWGQDSGHSPVFNIPGGWFPPGCALLSSLAERRPLLKCGWFQTSEHWPFGNWSVSSSGAS